MIEVKDLNGKVNGVDRRGQNSAMSPMQKPDRSNQSMYLLTPDRLKPSKGLQNAVLPADGGCQGRAS